MDRPVCAPTLLRQQAAFARAARPAHGVAHDGLGALARRRQTTARAGHSDSQTYEHFYLTLQAACAGLGVAIGSVFMARTISTAAAWSRPSVSARRHGYFLLSPLPFDGDARRTALLHWMRGQMGQARRRRSRAAYCGAVTGLNTARNAFKAAGW